MATSVRNSHAAIAIWPGSVLGEELKERKIKQKDFAPLIGLNAPNLNALIKGHRPMTAEIAIKLEQTLGIPYKFWMDFQAKYEYDLAYLKARERAEEKEEVDMKEISPSPSLILYQNV